jgi:hypothetical protein
MEHVTSAMIAGDNQVTPFRVPLKVNIARGDNWEQMEEIAEQQANQQIEETSSGA